jgi:hypothetical protein
MNPTSPKAEYLLLFRGMEWQQGLSPEEIQRTMTDWMAWFERLKEEGRCRGGQSLARHGRVISGKGRAVSDGPYAESKEAVAGYFILLVEDEEEALEIGKECPLLPYGMSVEVRPLLERCAASQRLLEAMQLQPQS